MKPKSKLARFTPAAPALLLLAAGLLAVPLLSAPQTAPEGRQSKPGEAQPGAPLVPAATGPRMPGEPAKPVPLAPQPIAGKLVRMEDALAAPPKPGSEQPTLQAARALKPSAPGGQRGRLALRTPHGSHLQLVLRVTQEGATEVVRATEVPGPATHTTEPVGDFVYEVTDGQRTLAAQALPDPFELRAFSPPGTTLGHHVERAKTAEVVVQVPLARTDATLDRIDVNLLKLQPGKPVERIDPAALAELKQAKRALVVSTVPAAKLAPQLRERMVPLDKVIEPPK